MTVITPRLYQCFAVRKALEFYIKTGEPINRAYTPANMLRTATNITGVQFKARGYKEAIDALTKHIESLTIEEG